MQAFRCGQQSRRQRLSPDRLAEDGLAPLHGGQDGRTGMLRGLRGATGATVPCAFEEVPAVGDLDCPRQGARDGAAVPAFAVAGDHLDAGTRPQPGLDGGGLAIRHPVDHPVPLQIADQRAVALPLPPGPVVEADRPGCVGISSGRRSDAAQKGVLADRQQKPPGERLCRATAESEAELPDDALKARRSPAIRAGKTGPETLRENLLTTLP